MAKGRKHVKAIRAENHDSLEQSEEFDDNPLPDASELVQLQAIDPSIMEFLKERASKEQDFRHSTFQAKVNVIENHNIRGHFTTRMALVIYFILVTLMASFSFILLYNEKNIQGSIFGGIAVILALAVLITRRSDPAQPLENTDNKPKPKQ